VKFFKQTSAIFYPRVMMTLSKRICGLLSLAVLFYFSTGFSAIVKEGDLINRVQAILGNLKDAISVKEIQTNFSIEVK